MFNINYNVVKNSVCSVVSDYGTGTGWLYRRANNTTKDKTIYVVTAAHVIMTRDDNNDDIVSIPSVLIHNVNNSGNNQMFQTKVISIDKKGDIALLEIENHRGQNNKYPLHWTNHLSLKVAINSQPIGIPIFIIGYPLGWDYNSFVGGYLRENNASDYFTPTSLYYNLATNSGNSGSPVFNTKNEVIGMLQWGLTNASEMNGGIRGDLLYHFLESSINSFIASNKITYNSFFKKNYISFFGINNTCFIPLTCELIQLFISEFNWGTAYMNGGRNINGILLLNNNNLSNLVLESVVYTDKNNITKSITLSSCIYDKSSIWEVIYLGKPNSNVTLNLYNLQTNTTFLNVIQLKEMPSIVDYFLTSGFSKKESYNTLIENLKIKEKINETKELITKNTDIIIENMKQLTI